MFGAKAAEMWRSERSDMMSGIENGNSATDAFKRRKYCLIGTRWCLTEAHCTLTFCMIPQQLT